MKFLKFALLIFILNFNAYLSSADEELIVTGSYLKDQTIEASPIAVSYTHLTLPTNREV